MDDEKRFDKIEKKIDTLVASTIRLEEQMRFIHDSIPVLRREVVDQCKKEAAVLGWKSTTTIVTAFITSLAAIITSILGR